MNHPFNPVNDDNEFNDLNFDPTFGCGGNLMQGEQGQFSAQGSCLEQGLISEQELPGQDKFLQELRSRHEPFSQELHSGQEPFSQVGGAGSNFTQGRVMMMETAEESHEEIIDLGVICNSIGIQLEEEEEEGSMFRP